MTALMSCRGESATTEVEPAEPAASDSPEPAEAEPPAPPPAATALRCDEWLSPAMVATACGETLTLAASEFIPDNEMSCRRQGELTSGARIELMIGKAEAFNWKVTQRKFPSTPAVTEERGRKLARVGAFPYLITVTMTQRGRASPVCDDAEASALASAIAAAVPRGEAPEVAADNPVCAQVLRTADLQEVCGKAIELRSTAMEDGESVFCNRTGSGGLVFIVSRHRDAATASRGKEVASEGGRGNRSVATHDRYLVELKSFDDFGETAACTQAQLDTLTTRITERLAAL